MIIDFEKRGKQFYVSVEDGDIHMTLGNITDTVWVEKIEDQWFYQAYGEIAKELVGKDEVYIAHESAERALMACEEQREKIQRKHEKERRELLEEAGITNMIVCGRGVRNSKNFDSDLQKVVLEIIKSTKKRGREAKND